MTALSLFFTHAAIGISITAYLIRKRKAAEKPICPIGGDCLSVLTSKYNKMLGVHNDVSGMIFYILMAFFSGLIVIGVEPVEIWNQIIVIVVGVATLLSIRFIYLQGIVLKAWCTWCVLSALTVFDMAIILILGNFDLTQFL